MGKGENQRKRAIKRIDKGIIKKYNTLQETSDEQSACFVTKNLVTKTNSTVETGEKESAVTGNVSVKQEAKPEGANNETPQTEIVRPTTSGGPSNAKCKVETNQELNIDNKSQTKNQNCVSCGISDWLDQNDHLNLAEEQDRVLIKNNNEILLYSTCGNSDSWIIEKVINRSKSPFVFYAKNDATKLEKFLAAEGSIKETIKRKCLLHSARCETCEILSRQNHRREGNLISLIWENITAEKRTGCEFQVLHKYSYRHDPVQTYAPAKSNIKEAAGHSKKLIRKAHNNGSLNLL